MLIKTATAKSNCFSFVLYVLVSSEVDVFKIQKSLFPLWGETGSWGFPLFSPSRPAHKLPSSLSWSATTQSSHHSLKSDYTKGGTQGVPVERLGSNCTNQTLPTSVREWDLSVTSFMRSNYSPKYPQYNSGVWRVILCSLEVRRPLSSFLGVPPRDLPKALVLSVRFEEEQRVLLCHLVTTLLFVKS